LSGISPRHDLPQKSAGRMTYFDPKRALMDELAAPNRPVTAVIGSGFTIASTVAGTPATWPALIADCAHFAFHVGLLTAEDRDRITATLAGGDAAALIAAAGELQRAFKTDPLSFERWLALRPGKFTAANPALRDAIRSLDCPIVTTNYDTLLSRDEGHPPVAWTEHETALQVLRGELEGIVHLHGVHTVPESIVFGDASYDRVRANRFAQFRQQFLAAGRTLLFIGCGEGLHDPNIGALFQWLDGLRVRHLHFRLVVDGEDLRHVDGVMDVAVDSYEKLPEFVRSLGSARGPVTSEAEALPKNREVIAISIAVMGRLNAVTRAVQDCLVNAGYRDNAGLLAEATVDVRRAFEPSEPLGRLAALAATPAVERDERVRAAIRRLLEDARAFDTLLSEVESMSSEGLYGSPAFASNENRLQSLLVRLRVGPERVMNAALSRRDDP
jgi:hypothetical protein